MPGVWRMDYGPEYADHQSHHEGTTIAGRSLRRARATSERRRQRRGWYRATGGRRSTRDAHGLERSTFPLSGLRYLAGLVGAFHPLARTRAEREQSGDSRLSIEERYSGRQDYLQRVRRASADLVRQQFLLQTDVEDVVEQAGHTWDTIVGR